MTRELSDFKLHLLDLTLEHPQIHPIYHIGAEWLHNFYYVTDETIIIMHTI